jgi:hypothetical protein
LVQGLSDVGEGLANLVVVLGRDGKHLTLMCRVLRNDHERGRTLTFDIELGSPRPVDLDIKRDAFLVSDGDPFVGNQDRRRFRGDVGANSLARAEKSHRGVIGRERLVHDRDSRKRRSPSARLRGPEVQQASARGGGRCGR